MGLDWASQWAGTPLHERGCRPEFADVAAHPRGLGLEHAGRLAGREQLERPGVVEENPLEVDLDPAAVPALIEAWERLEKA
jgi:hypothetical protein